MTNPAIIRTACLMAPALAAIALWCWRRPDGRTLAGILMAVLWTAPALLLVNLTAERFGWWRFAAEGGMAFRRTF